MIIMKKKFSIIIPIIILLLILSIILILHFTRNNNLKFIVFEKHYSLLYEEYPEFELSIFVTNDKCEYLKEDFIESSILYNDEESYNVMVSNNGNATKSKINNEIYFEEKVIVKLDFNSKELIEIKNAYLKLNFITGETLNVKIGNLCFSNNYTDNNLNIHKVQAIVNDFGMYDSLAAVLISISSNENCIIKSISPISTSLKVNNNFIKIDNNLEYDHRTSINDVLNTNYNFFNTQNTIFENINLTQNTKKDVIIPLCYSQNEYVDSIGFIIKYTIDDIEYTQIINPYKLYKSNKIGYFLNEYKLSND